MRQKKLNGEQWTDVIFHEYCKEVKYIGKPIGSTYFIIIAINEVGVYEKLTKRLCFLVEILLRLLSIAYFFEKILDVFGE